MTAELVFETRSICQLLRQVGAVELEPVISLQLELTGGPKIYASDASVINKAVWSMTIHRRRRARQLVAHIPGAIHYVVDDGKTRCTIDVDQSAERFAALLEMFKGGRASEITVTVDALADTLDYSKKWDTAAGPRLAIRAICFDFPLPQSEA